jgi:hypothetical protein
LVGAISQIHPAEDGAPSCGRAPLEGDSSPADGVLELDVLQAAAEHDVVAVVEAGEEGDLAAQARKASGWPKRRRLAHTFLWEYS